MAKMTALVELLKRQAKNAWKSAAVEDGCTMYTVNASAERYLVDFAEDFAEEGWLQFDTDQDAHYFGVWFNPKQFLTLTYAEGDWSLIDCHDVERYRREVQRSIDFYRPGYVAKVIGEDGQMVVCQQDRQEFLSDEPDLLTVGDVLSAAAP